MRRGAVFLTIQFLGGSGPRDQKRGARGGPLLPMAPGITFGFIGSSPSRCNFLRASLRARRMASAFSLHLLLQHLERLIDIVVTDENLHGALLWIRAN